MTGKIKPVLFEVVCTARYNRNLSERKEYIRCKSKKVLENSIMNCFNLDTTEYFGYTNIRVTEVKDVPELVRIKFKTKLQSYPSVEDEKK